MSNKKRFFMIIKATIKNLMVAFIYINIFYFASYFLFHDKITEISNFINLITIKDNPQVLADISLNFETNSLTTYPEYGTSYATLFIPSLKIELPVYFGDTMSILKKGLGHSSGSYFPGEGGSILYMGHNNEGILRNLTSIKLEDIITIKTSYGTYDYQVYDFKVIDYRDLASVPITHDAEKLMLYTCYPTTALGHTSKRFIVYAKIYNV